VFATGVGEQVEPVEVADIKELEITDFATLSLSLKD